MREFNEYDQDTNKIKINSGMKIFQKQLNGVEGKDIEIDGVLSRGIVLNHLNDMSTTKNQRGLNVHIDSPVKKGSYIKELDSGEIYLVMSRIDSHYTYKTCTMDFCNQTLNWYGLDEPVPCYCDNSSYGTKGILESGFIQTLDGKILFYTQYNEKTKQIKQDMRFIFDNSKNSIYKVVDVNRVVTGNVLRLVMDKDTSNNELDDFKNNIAYNEFLMKDIPSIEDVQYEIISETGVFTLKRWLPNTFSIINKVNGEVQTDFNVELDLSTISEGDITVNNIGNGTVEIYNNGFTNKKIKVKFIKGEIVHEIEVKLIA